METPEQIRDRLLARFPDVAVGVLNDPGPAAQHSLVVPREVARSVAEWLRDDPELRLDYCSNATGVDWPGQNPHLPETDIEAGPEPAGYLEVVYHLYSMSRKHGPVIIRVRTGNRSDDVAVPSLTPVWRSCEFQEREIYDLYGIVFTDHPDLRRILMWDNFRDHPMRKDYVEPDDFEWEPTAHGEVLERAKKHAPPADTGGAMTKPE